MQDVRRKPFRVLSAALLSGALLGMPDAVSAQDADEPGPDEGRAFVESLYGKRIEAVQRTRDDEDDLELMAEMLEIAPTLPDEPDAKTALYVRLAGMVDRSRAGHELALRALDALAEHNPGHPEAGPGRRLKVYASWYRAVDAGQRKQVAGVYFDELVAAAESAINSGDLVNAKRWFNEAGSVQRVNRLERAFNLRDKLGEVRAFERMHEELRELEAAAEANAISPAKARRLVVLLVLEMARPEQARLYAVFLKDAGFAQGLEAAASVGGAEVDDPGDHPPGHWAKAGNWYADLIDEPGLSEPAKERALVSARLMLARYVATTSKEDIEKARAVIRLRQLDELFEQQYAVKGDETDLLKLLDPKKHVIDGKPFTFRKGELLLPSQTILHLPQVGGEHYEVSMTVEADGRERDALIIWLPVVDRSARLIVDGGKHRKSKVDGLLYIDGSERSMRLDAGVPAGIRVQVKIFSKDQAAIRVWVNDQQTWQWRGSIDKLTDAPYGKPPDIRHFAIRSAAGITIQSLGLKRFDEDS